MITLHVLFYIAFIISCYRIKKASGGERFDPSEGYFIERVIFGVGFLYSVILLVVLSLKYLP